LLLNPALEHPGKTTAAAVIFQALREIILSAKKNQGNVASDNFKKVKKRVSKKMKNNKTRSKNNSLGGVTNKNIKSGSITQEIYLF
jgi:hypothetical protein